MHCCWGRGCNGPSELDLPSRSSQSQEGERKVHTQHCHAGGVPTVGAVRKVGGADCFPREELPDTTYRGAGLAQGLAHHRDSLSAGQVDGQEGTDDEG